MRSEKMELTVNEKEETFDPVVCVGDILQLDIDVYAIMDENGALVNLSTGNVNRYIRLVLPARKSAIETIYDMPIHAIFDGSKSHAVLTLVRKV